MSTTLPPALPLELRSDAERLFELTMWCLGRDVNHPDGNLLLRRGLSRERPPENRKGSSVYTASLQGGGALRLWAFGVLWDEGEEAIYVRRDGFTPLRVDAAKMTWPLFDAEALGGARAPATQEQVRCCRTAVARLAEWLAAYEEWVAQEVGLSWRRACLAERRKAAPVAAEALVGSWLRIKHTVSASSSDGDMRDGCLDQNRRFGAR